MSWANYYRAGLPAGASAREALAAARQVVATCARPPIELEVRWKISRSRDLAAFAERLESIAPAGARRVAAELLPADPQALLEIVGRCTHAVELSLAGAESAAGLSLDLQLARSERAGEFRVAAQLKVEGGVRRASDEVRAAMLRRLAVCRARGVLPIAASPEEVVARFLDAARREEGLTALAQGVEEDGYRLACRSWRGAEPQWLTIEAARPVRLAAADLAALWDEPTLCFTVLLRGRGCVDTGASLARLAGAFCEEDLGAFLELSVTVCGEAELDALVDVCGEDPVVAVWWCGFDDWGPAYHGVRLALHGRYQDGHVIPEPGAHEVIVMVDGKRRDPSAGEVAAGLAARAGLELAYVRTGL